MTSALAGPSHSAARRGSSRRGVALRYLAKHRHLRVRFVGGLPRFTVDPDEPLIAGPAY